MKRLFGIIFLFLGITACKPEQEVPPASQTGDAPKVEAEFIYPEDTTYAQANDTLRITLRVFSEAGMHQIGFRIETPSGKLLEQYQTHTHQGSLYFYDTLWQVKPEYKEYKIIGINIDHLNNRATDTVDIKVIN